MQPQTVTLIVACLGITGTLGGVVGGHLLGRSWQREQWIRDKRNEEFRELIQALSESYRVELTLHAGVGIGPDEQRMLVESQSTAMAVIRSRIFIADVVERAKVEIRWAEAIRNHRNTLDVIPLAETFTEIRVHILRAAVASRQRISKLA